MKIAIVSSSVRDGRNSHRVALFIKSYVERVLSANAQILDLKEYDFPMFHERVWNMPHPSEALLDYIDRFTSADGIVIVTPVYNGSFPASLKNVIDVIYTQWRHKPCLIVSVTDGKTPGNHGQIAQLHAERAQDKKPEKRPGSIGQRGLQGRNEGDVNLDATGQALEKERSHAHKGTRDEEGADDEQHLQQKQEQ